LLKSEEQFVMHKIDVILIRQLALKSKIFRSMLQLVL